MHEGNTYCRIYLACIDSFYDAFRYTQIVASHTLERHYTNHISKDEELPIKMRTSQVLICNSHL